MKLSNRLLKEISSAHAESKTENFKFFFDAEAKYDVPAAYFKFTIPTGTYEGQTHVLRMKFSHEDTRGQYKYPISPPNVVFVTPPPFHVNVSRTGGICLDTLQHNWIPSINIVAVYKTVLALLEDPNNSSAYRSEAHFSDTPKFFDKVKENYIKNQNRQPAIMYAPEWEETA